MKNEMLLEGPSIETNDNPKKLIFMLHGYGDNAENFIQVAESLRKDEWKANYYALNAPLSIPGFSSQGVYDGFQWFNIYPNIIYKTKNKKYCTNIQIFKKNHIFEQPEI